MQDILQNMSAPAQYYNQHPDAGEKGLLKTAEQEVYIKHFSFQAVKVYNLPEKTEKSWQKR